MTAASDNKFPKLIVTEGTAPSSPSAGDQKVYIDSSSHHLSRKNSAGTVVDLETNQASSGTTGAHGARVKRASTNFSVGNNVYTAIQFDAEDFDTDTIHDNSTNNTRLTIPSISGVTTGLWAVMFSAYSDQTTFDIQFRVGAAANPASGTAIGFQRSSMTSFGSPCLVVQWVFTAGDYVEAFGRTPGGSGNAVFDSGNSPFFSIAFLGKVT